MKIENNGYFRALHLGRELPTQSVETGNRGALGNNKEVLSVAKETKGLADLMNQFIYQDDIREEKLASIKERLDKGLYEVSGTAIIYKLTEGS